MGLHLLHTSHFGASEQQIAFLPELDVALAISAAPLAHDLCFQRNMCFTV